MSDEKDIRDLLGRAFAEEPPLRFERAQVIEQGRRVQRKRRLIAAGSAVGTLAAVAAGVVIVSGFNGTAGFQVDPAGRGDESCRVITPAPTVLPRTRRFTRTEGPVTSSRCPSARFASARPR